jgi:transmembrane sensor
LPSSAVSSIDPEIVGLSRLKPQFLIRRRAISWLVRLRGEPTSSDRAAFDQWYASDQRHRIAFERERERFDRDYGLLRNSPFAAEGALSTSSGSSQSEVRYALAATLAALLLVPLALLSWKGDVPWTRPGEAMMLVSQVGEIRTLTLADGSRVTLDTQSAVKVELGPGARTARLVRGRARFQISQGARPFILTAGSLVVRTQGATVDADRWSGPARVEVRRGSVEVGPSPGRQAKLGEGEAVGEVRRGGPLPLSIEQSDWTSGMLSFEAAPLDQAVATANRYSARRIRLADPALAKLRVTGIFHAGDTPRLARALARAFSLDLTQAPGGDFLLSREAPKKVGG